MGGGNGQKAAMARQRKADKDKKYAGGKSQLADNAKALTIICSVCRQSFMCNSTEVKLREHSDSRHPKQSFAECFPSFTS